MERLQSDAELKRMMRDRAAAQGWDVPASKGEREMTEPTAREAASDSDSPPVMVQRMRAEREAERQAERQRAYVARPSANYEISGWTEFKRGCWLAAGATAFFVVVVPVGLLILSIVGVSFTAILGGLLSGFGG